MARPRRRLISRTLKSSESSALTLCPEAVKLHDGAPELNLFTFITNYGSTLTFD